MHNPCQNAGLVGIDPFYRGLQWDASPSRGTDEYVGDSIDVAPKDWLAELRAKREAEEEEDEEEQQQQGGTGLGLGGGDVEPRDWLAEKRAREAEEEAEEAAAEAAEAAAGAGSLSPMFSEGEEPAAE